MGTIYKDYGLRHYRIGGRYLTVTYKTNPKYSLIPEVSLHYNHCRIDCAHPTAIALVWGLLEEDNPIEPLMDWFKENVELTGRIDYDVGGWKYADEWLRNKNMLVLEEISVALLNEQVQP